MKICIFTINTHLRGFWKSCFYFVLFFTVHSWFCWFKQCGEMSQCPHVAAEWAVKLRGWALWLAGSSLPYMNNNRYNKIKTVTKQFLCTNQGSLSRWQKATSHVSVMRLFLRVVSDFICQDHLWSTLTLFNSSLTSHIQHSTTHNTHSRLSMHTNIYAFTNPHRE